MAKQANLEESFDKLDEIISILETGDVSLEKSFQLYNEGMKLVKNCNSQLDKVEKQIIILNENEDNNGL
ncbi:MAG: exodeoxyribonuclease VII small subunit [Thermoflexaceae bacterium]|nr:exodeoxyribonuclease VII small subunit [Thermoflexaceae bacterium]